MTDAESNEKKGKGFAGLNSMVSDVSDNVEKAAKAALIAAPKLDWSIPSAAAPAAAPAPAPTQISDEQEPPVGRNNVLNIPQIRWCKREEIRIEAIESVINNAYEHDVDQFNAKVSDYNSRCGEFRYRRGNVEQVDRELASERESIGSKAKSEWVRGSLGLKDGTVAVPNKERTSPASKQMSAPRQDAAPLKDSLNNEESDSIESACSTEKTLYGPAAYNKCVSKKISALRSGPRNIDLSGLTYSEKESIESACSTQKTIYSPAEYNK